MSILAGVLAGIVLEDLKGAMGHGRLIISYDSI